MHEREVGLVMTFTTKGMQEIDKVEEQNITSVVNMMNLRFLLDLKVEMSRKYLDIRISGSKKKSGLVIK